MGECFLWYRPTWVVPDQRPLNGRCCCCCCLYAVFIVRVTGCLVVQFIIHSCDKFKKMFCCRNAEMTKELEGSRQMMVKKQSEIDQLQNEVCLVLIGR